MKKTIICYFMLLGFWASAQQTVPSTIQDTTFKNNFLQVAPIQKDETHYNNKSFRPYIIPTALITYGFLSLNQHAIHQLDISTKNELREDDQGFHTKIDNYLQYSPVAAVYILNATGIKGENNFRDRTFIYAISTIFSGVLDFSLKTIAKEERPDGSNNKSFPSGHTTTAFAAAAFMQHEYKDVSPWYGIAGYAAATATGILRLYNNKHWVGDIAAGAGMGILSTNLAYTIYPAIKRKFFKNKTSSGMVMPYYQDHAWGISMLYNFKK